MTLLIIFLLIIILFFSGFLTTLELAIYDFNFLVRPYEPVDPRIVIVGWDESSIQMLEENTISDDTLASLLKKISRQEPRLIGLDLYRDLPVFSPRLSDETNMLSYNSLQQIFRFTPNLIGIEKVVEPTVNPPHILKKRNSTAASDLPSDRDKTIRRSFAYPQEDENGLPAGIPYFGVLLGYEYLEREGWNAVPAEDNAIKILKSDRSITLNPLKNFAGIPRQDKYGFDFLVNWRKANPAFKKVSVIDVVSDRISPELFHDRLVIIGNVSASTADRHFIPLNRWAQPDRSWIYGVEIPAQVASSIISAGLDGRPLISPVSKTINLAITFIYVMTVISYINSLKDLDLVKIYSKALGCTLIISLVLFLVNIVFFGLGRWIPIGLPLSSIWLVYFVFGYSIYLEKKNENIVKLEMLVRDLHHSLGNPLHSIASSRKRIQVSIQELEKSLLEKSSNLPERSLDKIPLVLKRVKNIEKQANRIERYRRRLGEFVNFDYLSKTNSIEKIDVNSFIEEIIERFIAETEYDYDVIVSQDFDPRLTSALLDPTALEIVFENLLNNAFYAVASPNDVLSNTPMVLVKTLINNKYIQFTVEDNGVGIPPHLHQEIFRPFISFSNGQGIGLYLTKKILNLYGGNIMVSSKLNHGSKFIFYLPYKK